MNLDLHILTALRQSGENGVSGADLSRKLKVSRAAIWARIEELRELGYEIEATPHQGYQLLAVPDVLHADDLLSRLGPVRVVGRDIRVFQETSSTNDLIETFARNNVPEGAVVFAESQTKGRGRLGRKWISPPGKGLWFSVLLRPQLSPQAITRVTIAAAVALARAIRVQSGSNPEIKWPNDIQIQGKKIAGILTELNAELDTARYVVLGVGVNVNFNLTDLPVDLRKTATSLKIETGRKQDRAQLAAQILHELDADYARVRAGQFSEVADEWEQQCTTLGRLVTIEMGGHRFQGLAEALDGDGALLLRTQHGHLERIIGGDVYLEKP